jgi:hypothetical protein
MILTVSLTLKMMIYNAGEWFKFRIHGIVNFIHATPRSKDAVVNNKSFSRYW